ncbi:Ku protein [Paenibacillus thermoaerophilus]|uniref:Non-homologous end joining protein Ku n=1 Tax=Paenibacillus thermoaerophilus TaxID=1215385 RepID=A0ABW2V3M0_9BACL|nr:Ku protein [Paenibacillus thermoaerophilus]TMV11045.1 Ku protein [Paenibacillus thermoaerophilus]
MHTIWKGAISFGLVNVPVRMFSATEDKDISMKMVHQACGTSISYARMCKHCETEVPWEEIVKGYEYEPGHYVLFEKEELDALGETNKEIRILDFVDLKDIDPIYYQKTYYLGPGDTGLNAYNLLMAALRDTNKIGIANVSIRSKSSLAAIRIIEGCLVMETMFYPDEIRPVRQVPNLPEAAQVNDKELTMAKMLIEQLSGPFEPEKYTDAYREKLMAAIDAKIAGQEVKVAPEAPKTNVVDLMAALQASLESMRGGPAAGPRETVAVEAPATAAAKLGRKRRAPAQAAASGEEGAVPKPDAPAAPAGRPRSRRAKSPVT